MTRYVSPEEARREEVRRQLVLEAWNRVPEDTDEYDRWEEILDLVEDQSTFACEHCGLVGGH